MGQTLPSNIGKLRGQSVGMVDSSWSLFSALYSCSSVPVPLELKERRVMRGSDTCKLCGRLPRNAVLTGEAADFCDSE